MKYLIFGLGNIGPEYQNTRHNIGFTVLDALAEASNIVFKHKRHAYVTEYKFKGRTFLLIKPTTYMNLSGKAVNYWMQKEKADFSKVLIIVDDLALPFGLLRLKAKGGDGGHNGLKSIIETCGSQNFARLRFGIGDQFHPGYQINHVLGPWNTAENKMLPERTDAVHKVIQAFATLGIERTMNLYNNNKPNHTDPVC